MNTCETLFNVLFNNIKGTNESSVIFLKITKIIENLYFGHCKHTILLIKKCK